MPAKSLETRVGANSLPTLEDLAAERDRRTLVDADRDTPDWLAAARRRSCRHRQQMAALEADGIQKPKPEDIEELNRILLSGRDRLAGAPKDRTLAAAPIIEPMAAAVSQAIEASPVSLAKASNHSGSSKPVTLTAPDVWPKATAAEIAEQIQQLRSGNQAGRAPGISSRSDDPGAHGGNSGGIDGWLRSL